MKNQTTAEMSQPNRLIAYKAAEKLRYLGYEWDDKIKEWVYEGWEPEIDWGQQP